MARWDRTRRDRAGGTSLSMVALLASTSAAALLGAWSWLPGVLGGHAGVEDIRPELMQVGPGVRGLTTLGDGFTVSAYPSGLRWMRDDRGLLDGVWRGATLSAVTGRQRAGGDHPSESVERHYGTLRVTEVELLPAVSTLYGELLDGSGEPGLPVVLRTERQGTRLLVTAQVTGADAIIWHLDGKQDVAGLDTLPRHLRGVTAWAPSGRALRLRPPSGSLVALSGGLVPGRSVPVAVDGRLPGRLDVHVWAPFSTVIIQAPQRP